MYGFFFCVCVFPLSLFNPESMLMGDQNSTRQSVYQNKSTPIPIDSFSTPGKPCIKFFIVLFFLISVIPFFYFFGGSYT